MNKGILDLIKTIKETLWGREIILPIKYDCYKDEKVTKEQVAALNMFISHADWINNSKQYVEQYCEKDVLEDKENLKKDNIFSYIKPEYIYVKRDKVHPRVAIMCKYRYEPEHGIAVVFSSKGEITVGIQDIIL